MSKTNKISIVLPVYNGSKFLAQSIESCLNQSYKNLELIVVNDCSTDNSLQIAQNFAKKDPRVKIISNQKNQKLPASLNVGHKETTGDFITWTSDDNYFESFAIERLLSGMQNSNADVVYSDFKLIKDDGTTKPFRTVNSGSLMLGNIVGVCFLYKKEVYEKNNGYDENLHTIEDYDFWLRASLHSTFHHLPDVLYNYRNHSGSLSSNRENNEEMIVKFRHNLNKSYLNFFDSAGFGSKEFYASLFTKLHQYEEIDINQLLENFKSIKIDINLLCQKSVGLVYRNFLSDLEIKIRSNVLRYERNQNLKTLAALIIKQPFIFLNYDRRNSFKIIRKSLNAPKP